jgi:SOS-response transcriptional repressor LexA
VDNLEKQLDGLAARGDEVLILEAKPSVPRPKSEDPPVKMIPVLSWAHAGEAVSFEELPLTWQDQVPTECRDEKAFAVRLIGESMAPNYLEGDLLILQPSKAVFSGCLAVVRLANDGILFRRVEVRGSRLQLVPLNPQYKIEEFEGDDISWAYPLWGMWRQVGK